MKNLIHEIPPERLQQKVRRVVLGLGYLAVDVEGSGMGLCANILSHEKASCTVFPKAGTLKGSTVADLIELGNEPGILRRSIALAAINAVSNQGEFAVDGEVFDKVEVREGDRVVMVGFIGPVITMLESRGCAVDVFEHRSLGDERIRPQDTMAESISRADILIVTATSIINGTLPDILAYQTGARDVILMGPSTPMIPGAFASTKITWLAGCQVVDDEKALDIVMEGGGTQVLYRYAAMKKTIWEMNV